MRIDTPPFKQRTVYAHDVSHREGVCVWPALPVSNALQAVDKNQPLYVVYRTNNLCILHRFPTLLIDRLPSPV